MSTEQGSTTTNHVIILNCEIKGTRGGVGWKLSLNESDLQTKLYYDANKKQIDQGVVDTNEAYNQYNPNS